MAAAVRNESDDYGGSCSSLLNHISPINPNNTLVEYAMTNHKNNHGDDDNNVDVDNVGGCAVWFCFLSHRHKLAVMANASYRQTA